MFVPIGTPVVAVKAGTVTFVPNEGAGGNAAYLTANDGNTYFYAHLSPFVGRAASGSQGEIIGSHRHDRQRGRAAPPLRDPPRRRQRRQDRSVPDAQIVGLLSRHTPLWPTHSERSTHVLDPAYRRRPRGRSRSTSCGRCTPSASSSRPRSRTCAGSRRPASTSSRPRSTGGRAAAALEDLINALPQILADPGPRGDPGDQPAPMQMAPEQDSEWAPDLERVRRRCSPTCPRLTEDGARRRHRAPPRART